MRLPSLLAIAVCLLLPGCALEAQQHEPGTGSAQVSPASQAPVPVQQPDVRLDSKPHTDLDASIDSSIPGMDLGLGSTPDIDLGHDIVPTTPPGMLSRSEPGNPRMVYFSLPRRLPGEMTPADNAIVASRQGDLGQVAKKRGFDLTEPGWQYQQQVCPAMQPDAQAVVGAPAGEGGAGTILLHFVRHGEDGRSSAFTALIPRAGSAPVRVNPGARRKAEARYELLSPKTKGAVVNDALPPATLYAALQPVQGWIAASACIAQISGAFPQIPNEPFLSEEITTAPPPLLRLQLTGEREMVFTDRVNDDHYVVWDEHVSRRGRMRDSHHEQVKIVPRPVTNPPVPQPRMIADIPQPPVRTTPEPPSPLSGDKQ